MEYIGILIHISCRMEVGYTLDIADKIKEFFNYMNEIIQIIKTNNIDKIICYIKQIPLLCSLNAKSNENRRLRELEKGNKHPVGVSRGEIYDLEITEGVGSELSDHHLVIIIQNKKGNIFSEKVNVLPIEGDGKKFNPNYQKQLKNTDLEEGRLDKDPSRIIITDILTFDKSRLKRRIGKIKPDYMKDVIDRAIKRQLDLK